MFKFTLKATRYNPLSVRGLEARTLIEVAANTRQEAEDIAAAALGDPAPGTRWVFRTESIRQIITGSPSLARAWDEGANTAWERSTPEVNGQTHHWRHEGEPLNPYREDNRRG